MDWKKNIWISGALLAALSGCASQMHDCSTVGQGNVGTGISGGLLGGLGGGLGGGILGGGTKCQME